MAAPFLFFWTARYADAKGFTGPEVPDQVRRPNFLLIVADDMGYSDIAPYGGEIDTPNLDWLAASGVKFTDFYVSPTCSPTRSMLLTGNDSHLAGLGSMAEALRPEQRGRPGYEGYLNRSVATIAERLRGRGYYTAMAGKWHLGGRPGQIPADRGFDRSFALINGAANYYGLDQGGAWAGTLFASRYFENNLSSHLPEGAYTTDYFTTRLIDFLQEDDFGGDRPFFAYLAFNAPHTPLQAPRELVEKYNGYYDSGPEALASYRLQGLARMDIVPDDARAHPMVDVPAWSELSAADRAASVRRMQVYAAAIDRLDQNIGRVIQALRESGELDNTVIIVLSDNGAEGTDEEVWLEFLQQLGLPGELAQSLRSGNQDISLIGSGQSYVGYGPGWAQAVMSPFALTKGFTAEGGVRAPLIVSGAGIDRRGIIRSTTHVTDIVPTILDLAGFEALERVGGRTVRIPEGLSLKRQLSGLPEQASFSSRIIGWELFGRRAIRQGPWKAVYMNEPSVKTGSGSGLAHWSLYDVRQDPGEITDLSAQNPDILRELISNWNSYAEEKGVVLVPPLENRGPHRSDPGKVVNGETGRPDQ